MDSSVIRIDTSTQPSVETRGVLIDSSSGSTLLQLSPDAVLAPAGLDALVLRAAPALPELALGGHSLVSMQCVSDVSLITHMPASDVSALVFDASSLAAASPLLDTGAIDMMDLSQPLSQALPAVQAGLQGQLSQSELSALIQDVQGQLLQLNQEARDLFGDLSADIENAMAQLSGLGDQDVLSSASVDTATFAGFASAHGGADLHSSASTTLDALFTAPESFPLTLDFSDARHVESATELFSSLSSGSGISSGATAEGSQFAGDQGFDVDKV